VWGGCRVHAILGRHLTDAKGRVKYRDGLFQCVFTWPHFVMHTFMFNEFS